MTAVRRLCAIVRRNLAWKIAALLAATALHHGLRFVTRNASDFAFPGLDVIDPWRA